jgi:hypothetical protein
MKSESNMAAGRPKRKAKGSTRDLSNQWTNLQSLIDDGGEITLGRVPRTKLCAVTASDEDQCLAMLQRREDESLVEMLDRLDAAVAYAWENDEFIDEINS